MVTTSYSSSGTAHCEYCGAIFVARPTLKKRFCSPDCRNRAAGKKKGQQTGICRGCGTVFVRRASHQVYCGVGCRNLVYDSLRDVPAHVREFSSGSVASATVGAVGELAVAADLMRRGFVVFRALSPACLCDLLALVNGCAVRIEVRTGRRTVDGEWFAPIGRRDLGRQDVFALVTHDGVVEYCPGDALGVESAKWSKYRRYSDALRE